MASSVRALLIKYRKRVDGAYPIAIRIIVDRRPHYIYIGQNIKEKDWNPKDGGNVKSSHANYEMINALIGKKKAEANKELIMTEIDDKEISSLQVKNKVSKKNSKSSFFKVAADYFNDLEKTKKYNRLIGEQSRVKYFKDFINTEVNGTNDISLQQINEPLLKKFSVYLKFNRSASERTIVNYLIVIRTIFNRAIDEGVVDKKYYPFGKGRVRIRIPESYKVGLIESELKEIQGFSLKVNSPIWNARNIWLTSFYLAGARISDVLRIKWSDIKDERLHYTMGKNLKPVTIKIPDKILSIFSFYESEKRFEDDFVFAELKKANSNDPRDEYRKIRTANKKINYYMAMIAKSLKINKKVSAHIARHTFGNISGEKISPLMLQKLYRHSDLRTTMGYQANFIHKDVDEALASVVNF